MGPVGPLPCSQKPANGPHREPSQDLYQEKEFSILYSVVMLHEEPHGFRGVESTTESTAFPPAS
jgi:hypothetical protein